MNIEKMTLSQIKNWLQEATPQEISQWMPDLEVDSRLGIRSLVRKWHKEQERENRLIQHWKSMLHYEKNLRQQGYSLIAGVDEVGRGPLAGPVVAAAVILSPDFYLPGLNDSKQLSSEQRHHFALKIKQEALAYSVSYIDHKQIDQINIYQATKKAMREALDQLAFVPEYALIDALSLPLPFPHKVIIKGDSKSVSIAAASIVAKEERDQWMISMAELYPEYGFEQHKGYGTKEHRLALEKYGPTPIHRRSFLKFLEEG